MKTSELQGALLDYWTARAEGVPADQLEMRATGTLCVRNMPPLEGHAIGMVLVLDYSTNWALTGPLAEKHGICLSVCLGDGEGWAAWLDTPSTQYGDAPPIAICRAVVRAAFGDEVGDLPCA